MASAFARLLPTNKGRDFTDVKYKDSQTVMTSFKTTLTTACSQNIRRC